MQTLNKYLQLNSFSHLIDCRQLFDAFLSWILSNQTGMIDRAMFEVRPVPSIAPEKKATSNFGLFHTPWSPFCSKFWFWSSQPRTTTLFTQQTNRFESVVRLFRLVSAICFCHQIARVVYDQFTNIHQNHRNQHKQISSKSNFDHTGLVFHQFR